MLISLIPLFPCERSAGNVRDKLIFFFLLEVMSRSTRREDLHRQEFLGTVPQGARAMFFFQTWLILHQLGTLQTPFSRSLQCIPWATAAASATTCYLWSDCIWQIAMGRHFRNDSEAKAISYPILYPRTALHWLQKYEWMRLTPTAAPSWDLVTS